MELVYLLSVLSAVTHTYKDRTNTPIVAIYSKLEAHKYYGVIISLDQYI